jgi:GntR family transcriptional regulator/MocR family aminotransferase
LELDYIQGWVDDDGMSRMTASEEIFFLDRSQDQGLQAQLRASLVSAILARRLLPGTRLPSTRRLAKHLNVSRITVTLAYQELVSQGYLATAKRSGFFVSESAPVAGLDSKTGARPKAGIDWTRKLPRSLSDRRRIEKPYDWRTFPYPFIYGQMDMSLFNHNAWRDCARRALGRRDFEDMASDFAAADDPMLVNYICARTLPRRGIAARPEEVLVTVGAQNALWLVIQLLMRDGLHAVCENPGYPDLVSALRWSGARVSPIDVDDQGLPTDRLPPEVDVVFVTPSHHAPTAVTLPLERRTKLLEAADAQDFIVVEDDYEFEMSFLAPPSPALMSLDRSGRVLYLGSFSKALFPGLRLGYLVGPEAFIREARQLRSLMLRHPPGHQQRTVAYFLALGHYDSLIRDLRAAFAERREITTRALERAGLEISGAASFGGTNLWVKGPEGLDSLRFAEALRQDGVLIESGAPFFDNCETPIPFFRMAYSSIPTKRIEEGVARIARRLAAG